MNSVQKCSYFVLKDLLEGKFLEH